MCPIFQWKRCNQIDNNGHNALYWASVNNLNYVKAKIEKNKYEIYTGRALLVCGIIGVVSGLIGYRYVSSKWTNITVCLKNNKLNRKTSSNNWYIKYTIAIIIQIIYVCIYYYVYLQGI